MSISLPEILLNSDIDPDNFAATLQDKGFVQIHNFFSEETAVRLLDLIKANNTWYVAYNDGDNYYESPLQDFNNMPPHLKQQFMTNIYSRAGTSFQYLFNQYYITQAIEKGEEKGNPIHVMHDFVNADPFMNFIKKLTGENKIKYVESFVSSYRPGHFLTNHDDTHDNDRVVAYTIGMTKDWEKDWGGHLAFFDDDGNIKQALIPSFNTLSVFLIPQPHAVQFVAPFAKANRVSFLGWANR